MLRRIWCSTAANLRRGLPSKVSPSPCASAARVFLSFILLHPPSIAGLLRAFFEPRRHCFENRIAGDILLQGLPYYKVPCE
jgi:hypothetical protein